MTAYELTKTDYTGKVKPQTYQANTLAFLLISNNSKDLRAQPEYKEAEDIYYEVTGSCNMQEAKHWLNYFQANAIAYGIATQDKKWGYYFLAAYDMSERLTGRA